MFPNIKVAESVELLTLIGVIKTAIEMQGELVDRETQYFQLVHCHTVFTEVLHYHEISDMYRNKLEEEVMYIERLLVG